MTFVMLNNNIDHHLNLSLGRNNWVSYCININNNHINFQNVFKPLGLTYNIWNSDTVKDYKTYNKTIQYRNTYKNLFKYLLQMYPDRQYFFLLEDTCYLANDINIMFNFLSNIKNIRSDNKWDILWLGYNGATDRAGMIANNLILLLNSNIISALILKRETIQSLVNQLNLDDVSSIENILNSDKPKYVKIAPGKTIFQTNKRTDLYYGGDRFYDYNLIKDLLSFMTYDLLLKSIREKTFKSPVMLLTETDDITDLLDLHLENDNNIISITIITNKYFPNNVKLNFIPKSIKVEQSYSDFSQLLINVKNCKQLSTSFSDDNFSKEVIDRCFIICDNFDELWLALYFNRIPLVTFDLSNSYYNTIPHIKYKDNSVSLDELYNNFIKQLLNKEFNTDFLKLNYWKRKIVGNNYSKINKTLLVAVLTKNVMNNISDVLYNIETYTSLFTKYKVCIVDGYSSDGTSEYCKNWCNKEPEKRILLSQVKKNLSRPLGLEEARNMYINYFEPYFNNETYLLCIDGDEVNSKDVDIDGFLSNFKYDNWDGMFCNNTNAYYDIWALRKEDCDYDCWEMVRATNDMSYVDRHTKKITRHSPIIPVTSAFGGAGIYLTEKLKGIKYSSFNDKGKEICEHVPFNTQLVNKGAKLYINPDFVNM